MKKNIKIILTIILLAVLTTAIIVYGKELVNPLQFLSYPAVKESADVESLPTARVDASDYLSAHKVVGDLPIEKLSADEENGLIIIREEEKLAHDVYVTLYEKWKINIFKNISSSELTHTEAVKYLLDKYELEDPVKDSTVGVFTNPEFTSLYASLVEKGSLSLKDALMVGATIEDLDIYDIKNLSEKINNQDISLVYANLEKGSRNHLRSFSKQLEKQGEKYSAQYLSQEEVDKILSSERETSTVLK